MAQQSALMADIGESSAELFAEGRTSNVAQYADLGYGLDIGYVAEGAASPVVLDGEEWLASPLVRAAVLVTAFGGALLDCDEYPPPAPPPIVDEYEASPAVAPTQPVRAGAVIDTDEIPAAVVASIAAEDDAWITWLVTARPAAVMSADTDELPGAAAPAAVAEDDAAPSWVVVARVAPPSSALEDDIPVTATVVEDDAASAWLARPRVAVQAVGADDDLPIAAAATLAAEDDAPALVVLRAVLFGAVAVDDELVPRLGVDEDAPAVSLVVQLPRFGPVVDQDEVVQAIAVEDDLAGRSTTVAAAVVRALVDADEAVATPIVVSLASEDDDARGRSIPVAAPRITTFDPNDFVSPVAVFAFDLEVDPPTARRAWPRWTAIVVDDDAAALPAEVVTAVPMVGGVAASLGGSAISPVTASTVSASPSSSSISPAGVVSTIIVTEVLP